MEPVIVGFGERACEILGWFRTEVMEESPTTIGLSMEESIDASNKVDTFVTLDRSASFWTGTTDKHEEGGLLIEENEEHIKERLQNKDPIILVNDLGSGTNRGANPVLARLIGQLDKSFLSIITHPYRRSGQTIPMGLKSSIRRIKFYSDQTFKVDLKLLSRYLSEQELAQLSIPKLENQVISNLLYYLSRSLTIDGEMDPEAIERLISMDSVQKHNLLLNIFAPKWHSGIPSFGVDRHKPETPDSQSTLWKKLLELLDRWLVEPVRQGFLKLLNRGDSATYTLLSMESGPEITVSVTAE